MTTTSQDKNFSETLGGNISTPELNNSALDDAIVWISSSLDPEDVFSVSDLEKWAENNGFIEE